MQGITQQTRRLSGLTCRATLAAAFGFSSQSALRGLYLLALNPAQTSHGTAAVSRYRDQSDHNFEYITEIWVGEEYSAFGTRVYASTRVKNVRFGTSGIDDGPSPAIILLAVDRPSCPGAGVRIRER